MQEFYVQKVAEIRDYFGKHAKKRAVVGLSGGLDSAVALKLVVDALKPENVVAIHLPEHGVTGRVNTEHAARLADYFGVQFYRYGLNRYVRMFDEFDWSQSQSAKDNLRARLRMIFLYDYANSTDALVVSALNKSDLTLGYATKHGDLAADVFVLDTLYKTEIIKLAEFLNLPLELLDKKPSGELRAGQLDEIDLGATYYVIDQILIALEKGYKTSAFDPVVVRKIEEQIARNRHKRVIV